MKALISPNEFFTWTWTTSWKKENEEWVSDTTELIEDCFRVAQVEQDSNVFPVAEPLFWADCPDNCISDSWYYKDGHVLVKPESVEKPQG
jgi:hypothetical protein